MWSQIKSTSFVMISVAGLLVALTTNSLLLAELSKGLSIVCLLLAMKTMVEAGLVEKN
jgi:hypothetical protein